MEQILISACLCGFAVRYNGSAKPWKNTHLLRWHAEGRLVICCPEIAAGLPVPRLPAEIQADGAHLLESDGNDATAMYQLAAQRALQTALAHHCRFALLTDGSPSCGSQQVYDGSFQQRRINGIGFTARLLREHGINVYAEHEAELLATRLMVEEHQAWQAIHNKVSQFIQ
ncbi:DUF523 domain-containing protein [Duffyella gerundensis]|uniref:DUF523 domain-containing protein n=1 Tax=Duffyella TaxID=3026546 RepID=UPI0016547B85|nr:DUF523 domain-containing protein [Duffyella gerundensis]